jgi:glutamine amidotransferase
MTLFNKSGFREPMEAMIERSDVRVLGICVGMQMLANGSDEGSEAGLGWVPGYVRRFDHLPAARSLPRPHMGWNDVVPEGSSPLFDGLSDWRCYFLHSFYFECETPGDSLATAEYGDRFSCAIGREHVFGVQFHPEKSHHWGQAILGNFART